MSSFHDPFNYIPYADWWCPWGQKGWLRGNDWLNYKFNSHQDWLERKALKILKCNPDGSADASRGYSAAPYEEKLFINYEKKLLIFVLVQVGCGVIVGPGIVKVTFEELNRTKGEINNEIEEKSK